VATSARAGVAVVTDIHNLPVTPPAAANAQDGAVPDPDPDPETGEVMTNTAAPYQLLALKISRSDASFVAWRRLGRYRDLETAVRARVEDVLQQLAANDGWLINAQHLIIGPGHDGPATVHSYISEVGADPGDDRVPTPHNEPALRRWLLSAHSLP
jgi:hypothetical protein